MTNLDKSESVQYTVTVHSQKNRYLSGRFVQNDGLMLNSMPAYLPSELSQNIHKLTISGFHLIYSMKSYKELPLVL